MKRVILSILVALTGVCAYAQKGQLAGGLNMNITPCLESGVDLTNFGLAAKLQYGFSNSFRGELQVGYDFESKGISLFHASGNFHYLISVSERFNVYPVVSAGYGILFADLGKISVHKGKFLINEGLGSEYDITDHLSIGIELKYQYITDFSSQKKYQYLKELSRLPISLGVAYKF